MKRWGCLGVLVGLLVCGASPVHAEGEQELLLTVQPDVIKLTSTSANAVALRYARIRNTEMRNLFNQAGALKIRHGFERLNYSDGTTEDVPMDDLFVITFPVDTDLETLMTGLQAVDAVVSAERGS